MHITSRILLTTALTAALASLVNAQSTFTTASGNQSWGSSSNWSTGSVPNAIGAEVIFNSPVGGSQAINSFGLARTVGSWTINNDSTNAFSVTTTNVLTFDNTIGNAALNVNGTGNVTNTFGKNLSITLTDSLDINITNTSVTDVNGALAISGIISGAGGINKTGEGTVSLLGANTFTGGLIINQGTVRITSASGLGATPASAGTDNVVLNGGRLQFDGSSNSSSAANRGFTLGSANGEIAVTNTGTFTISGVVAGTGNLAKTGTGTLYLNATNTYSGGTVIQSGSVRVGASASLGNGTVTLGSTGGGSASLISNLAGYTYANNINVVAGSGGTLTLGSDSTAGYNSIFSGAISIGDNLTVTTTAPSGNRLSFTGVLSGTGDITKIGTGELRLTNDNTWTGNLAISEGSVNLTSTGELRFDLADGGVTNQITGDGSAQFDGTFVIDTSALTGLGSWQLVDTSSLATTFGSSFTLTVLNGDSFTQQLDGTTYTLDDWSFSTLTGTLTLGAAIPEPSTMAALAGVIVLGCASLRRRRQLAA
jgi:fibronectin-binding autotransporter adhesin